MAPGSVWCFGSELQARLESRSRLEQATEGNAVDSPRSFWLRRHHILAHQTCSMRRSIRYQAAVVLDDHLLLLKVLDGRTGKLFWVFPGGGQESGETEEECVEREVREETHLCVAVTRFLFEVPDIPEGNYDRLRTYLCVVREGTARPGIEPEVDEDPHPIIREIGWFHLRQPEVWDPLLHESEITYYMLEQVREALGYLP
jgi:8-oxo-dGTP pyrophosphatase MutT (NUDIX family)